MSYKLVADSGSTKTDWALIGSDEVVLYSSPGTNPSTSTELFDLEQHCGELLARASEVESIHYFGAGVIDDRTRGIIQSWLGKHFNKAEFRIEGDMLGAAKATAGDSEGIVCIMGTGSNSCLYDGEKIIDNIPALGYILSNEGGGSRIGMELLRNFFYRQMPSKVSKHFEEKYQLSKSTLVKELYSTQDPTYYLARYARFLNETEDKEWRKAFLFPIFQKYVDIRIKQYEEYLRYDLYFVGSIAYFYGDVINDVLAYNGLRAKSMIRKPIDGLVDYFK